MTSPALTLGQAIVAARKAMGMSQKDLAAAIVKEDGAMGISPQYLNDIEHERRNPPSEFIIEQLAKQLQFSTEYLTIAAGMLPADMRKDVEGAEPEHIQRAYRAFRQSLKKR